MEKTTESKRMIDIQVRFRPGILRRIDQVARRDDRSRSYVIRLLAERGLSELEAA